MYARKDYLGVNCIGPKAEMKSFRKIPEKMRSFLFLSYSNIFIIIRSTNFKFENVSDFKTKASILTIIKIKKNIYIKGELY
jgi:hypothetical protein